MFLIFFSVPLRVEYSSLAAAARPHSSPKIVCQRCLSESSIWEHYISFQTVPFTKTFQMTLWHQLCSHNQTQTWGLTDPDMWLLSNKKSSTAQWTSTWSEFTPHDWMFSCSAREAVWLSCHITEVIETRVCIPSPDFLLHVTIIYSKTTPSI